MEENTATPTTDKSVDEKAPKPVNKSWIYIVIILLLILTGAGFYILGTRKTRVTPTPSPTALSEPTTPTGSPLTTTGAIATSTAKPTSTPTLTASPTPTASPLADLYISEYSFDHPPKTGEPFTVRIGIYNQGDKAAGGFYWEWWATTSAPNYACRERIDSLAAHGGRIVNCTYTYGGWANYTTKAIADSANEVPESDETNNTKQQQVIPIH